MLTILSILSPILVLMALGQLLRRNGLFGAEFWRGVEALVYYVCFPALLFGTLATQPIQLTIGGPMILTGIGFMLGGMLMGLVSIPVFTPTPRSFASLYQCAFRFNAYIGFALLGGLYGHAGIAAFALLAGFVIPMVNVASVWALARHQKQSLLRELLRNPFILATFAGLTWSALALPMPDVLHTTLLFLGEPALPLGLLATGASLSLRLEARQGGLVGYFIAVKLLAVPLLALGLAILAGLEQEYLAAAVLLAALPPAASASILANRMGGDGALVATTVGVATLLSALSLPVWLWILGL